MSTARFSSTLACLVLGAMYANPLSAATPAPAPQARPAPKVIPARSIQASPEVLLVPREHLAPRRGINMDAGVPPSGVPEQTRQA